jgi:hypothetical protein
MLDAAGRGLDAAFVSNDAYATWRAGAIAGLVDVDAMCAEIDGEPPTDSTGAVATLRATVEARAKNAATSTHVLARYVLRAARAAQTQSVESVDLVFVNGALRRPEAERFEALTLERIAAAVALAALV